MTLLLVLETPTVSSQTQNVDETLAQAEAASGKAYLTLVKTERSGGDISGLAVKFNTDLEELAHARTLLREGQVGPALVEAERARSSFLELTQEGGRVADTASEQSQQHRFTMYIVIIVLVAATTVAFYVSLRGWRKFDRERTLEMHIVEKEKTEA
jgi:hypothetical protein